jgi:class 3 adenylate cyclase/low affinity Fe/Cu permease
MSLRTKILSSIIVIILIIITTTLYFIQINFDQSIQSKTQEQFEKSINTFNGYIYKDVTTLQQVIKVTTFGATFTQNLLTRDQATIQNAIDEAIFQTNFGEVAIFDIMIVLDTDFNVIATNDETTEIGKNFENHPVISDLFEEYSDFSLRTYLSGGKMYQVYAEDVSDDINTYGYVIIGRVVDNLLADNLNFDLKTDFTFFSGSTGIGTSLQRQVLLDLESFIGEQPEMFKNFEDSIQPIHRAILGPENHEYLIRLQQMDNNNDAYYVLSISYTDEIQAFNATRNLIIILGAGAILLGVLFSIFFSRSITKPIFKLVDAVTEIERENYNVQVDINSKDEIGVLANNFNTMTKGLGERFELLKFVSKNTLKNIQKSGHGNLELGGERKRLTMFFSDIRGFTAFSEKHEPEEVIEMLNLYLRKQAEIVHEYNGDIDKFVGDELMAIFEGEDADFRAVQCAKKIQVTMEQLRKVDDKEIYIGIGINSGEVISGNMGSEDRIDHTVLGNHVNLAARLCSKADRKQTLVSDEVYRNVNKPHLFDELEAIQVKGITDPVQIYEVRLKL